MKTLEQQLRDNIKGDVYFDPITRRAYSVDASIYEIEPLGVIVPKHKIDVLTAVAIANEYKVSIIPRGAATGITGGCLGKGLILDMSKYMSRILEINYEEEFVYCEPGIVLDTLNKVLASQGYRLGPETSTGNRATLGGMIGNNAAGSHSLRYGKMVDHVLEIEMVTASGDLLGFGAIDEAEWAAKRKLNTHEGTIYKEVFRIVETYREEIEHRFPKIPRRVSGYNLDELIKPGPLNLAKLITGSEGTLGVVTEMKLRICKSPMHTGICIIHCNDMIRLMEKVPELLSYEPMAIEMIDENIIERGLQSPALNRNFFWLKDKPTAIFVIELEGGSPGDLLAKLQDFAVDMANKKIGYAHPILTNPTEIQQVWNLRKSGLGLLLSKRTYSRAIAFIEDISVHPNKLASFMEKFLIYLRKHGKEAGIYGHAGSGCLHIRPYIDLRKEEEVALMETMMNDIAEMIAEIGGALSGEHGDGLVRSWLNSKMFGAKIYEAFTDIKSAFDPTNMMNPGKIVNGPPLRKDLRMTPQIEQTRIPVFQDFSREGGFELAVDLCNGNGQCRKTERIMCPSYQASGNEYDTTRARAQALKAIVNKKIPTEMLTSDEVMDVLDLCLECKGCKTECPSHIDMAKMKAEVLYQYQEKHGYSLRNRLFGHIGTFYRLAAPIAPLVNLVTQSRLGKICQDWLGISPQRTLPKIHHKTFSRRFADIEQPILSKRVVLFNDTYTEFNSPDIGEAAVHVLNALGYQAILPEWRCCGRPLISKGMLKQARIKAEDLIDILYNYAKEGIPIIGIEPSCILTIADDFHDLINADFADRDEKMSLIQKAALTFDEFVCLQLHNGKLPIHFLDKHRTVLVHGHCHQKSLVGMEPTLAVLKAIPGAAVKEINSGCCGMAGSFGYEKEHYEFSLKIGELKLFPAIWSLTTDVIIIANGMSCRTQIQDATKIKALHIAEFIHDCMISN
jgi:FAD/FMN-containing dehydrogenase/Fe-S oxidoreductase